MRNIDVLITLGTAGSGKTSLIHSLSQYLNDRDVYNVIMNLDPGVKETNLPFEPDINVRNYVRVEDVMDELNLGPNGAFIASIDLLVQHIDELRDEILSLKPDILLVDTPGQMELFAYRRTGPLLIDLLFENIPDTRLLILFLFDPFLCEPLTSLFSLILLSESVFWRFRIPIINVLTKIDAFDDNFIQTILEVASNPSLIFERENENETNSILISTLMQNDAILKRELIPISAVTGEGMFDLYSKVLDVLSREE